MSTNKPLKVGDRVTLVGGAWGGRHQSRTVTVSKGPQEGRYADGCWTDERGFDWYIWNDPADEFGCVPQDWVVREGLADWEYELLYGGTPHDEPIFAGLLHAYGYPSMGYLISEDSAQYLTEQGPQEGQTWLLTVERGTYAGQMEAQVVWGEFR